MPKPEKRYEKQRPIKILTLILIAVSAIIQFLSLIFWDSFNLIIVIWIGLIINLVILTVWLVFNLMAYRVKISAEVEKKY